MSHPTWKIGSSELRPTSWLSAPSPAAKSLKARVSRLLREAGVRKPPVPIDRIARSLRADVRFEPFDGDVSGVLIRDSGKTVIGVNAAHQWPRQRFTIAHEIAHLLLHKGYAVHFDRAPFRVNFRNNVPVGADPEEIEANRFAAELLMPEAFVHRDLLKRGASGIDVSDDEPLVRELAERYEVSIQAMAIRLAHLR